MSPARAGAAAFVVALACAAASAFADDERPPSGEQILGRAKAVFRTHERPAYVVYTVVRRDKHDGAPDFENSYTLKIWCRTGDRAALMRREWNGVPIGGALFDIVAFDGRVDPGPPSADIFERALYGRAPSIAPTPVPLPSDLKRIGSVVVTRDDDYHVTQASREGTAWHLALEPKRDPARNRIGELWVDAQTYEVQRMRVRDHLYLGLSGQSLADEFDVRFTAREGLPLIATIHGETQGAEFETDYTYRDVAFPSALPDWYFDPRSYGAHKDALPE
jgi:hypothetical protein